LAPLPSSARKAAKAKGQAAPPLSAPVANTVRDDGGSSANKTWVLVGGAVVGCGGLALLLAREVRGRM